jgi:hypothetical protein
VIRLTGVDGVKREACVAERQRLVVGRGSKQFTVSVYFGCHAYASQDAVKTKSRRSNAEQPEQLCRRESLCEVAYIYYAKTLVRMPRHYRERGRCESDIVKQHQNFRSQSKENSSVTLRLKCAQSVSTSTNTPSEISSPEFRRVCSRRSRSAFVVLPNTDHLDLASAGARAMLSTPLLLPFTPSIARGCAQWADGNCRAE